MSSFVCFPSRTCWQECEETGYGYAACDGAIHSITLEGLSVSVGNFLNKKIKPSGMESHTHDSIAHNLTK